MQLMEKPRLLRTADAARELGVSSTTLWRWSRTGKVKPAERTLGGQDRWNLDDLREQIRKLQAEQDEG